MTNKLLALLFAVLFITSCASHKEASKGAETGVALAGKSASAALLGNIDKAKVASANIVGNAQIRLTMGDKNITVPGALRMRRDEVIRLQVFVPILGTEVGRLEFTPDRVLIVDRFHKQYVEASYNEVDFLKKHGISFYSLQSLFWNELVCPGEKAYTSRSANSYNVELNEGSNTVPVTLKHGNLAFQWNTNRNDNKIASALVTYNDGTGGASMLSWLYDEFTSVGGKSFPRTQDIGFQTMIKGKNQKGEMRIKMSEVRTSNDWEAHTSVGDKYTKVTPEQVLSMLMSF